jgi:hypothetical protein
MVGGQLALTVVLLCGSGLLARSFRELSRVDTGVDSGGVLTLNVGLDGEPYDSRGAQYVGFYQRAFERIGALPGVRSVAAGHQIPVTGGLSGEAPFQILGAPELSPSERPLTNLRMVTPGYFRTLGIPLLRGRDFSLDDLFPRPGSAGSFDFARRRQSLQPRHRGRRQRNGGFAARAGRADRFLHLQSEQQQHRHVPLRQSG